MLDGSPHVGCFEELFGGYTATVQARATYLVALDYRHAEPGGRAVEGGGVTSGSSSDYDDIELLDLVSHGLSLQ